MASLEIPPEMIRRYLERRQVDLEILQQGLNIRDAKVIARIAHQVRGNAPSFGFQALSEIAQNLEEAAKLADWSAIEIAVRHFKQWVEKNVVSR
jgi:HPt (histidine-containing phosphotransfer) domain-containing protein